MKYALIIHGWPEPIYESHILRQYFESRGYAVFAPYVFSSNYKLTLENVRKLVLKKMGGKKPDVIAGVSLGGLFVPYIALKFPKADLVFISTAPKIDIEKSSIGRIIRLSEKKGFFRLFGFLISLPSELFYFVLRIATRILRGKFKAKTFQDTMRSYLAWVLGIPVQEEKEIFEFVKHVDNTHIIGTLGNKSIIFAGKKDTKMPIGFSIKLKELLKFSRLIVTNGEHFNVFTLRNYKDLDEFLGN